MIQNALYIEGCGIMFAMLNVLFSKYYKTLHIIWPQESKI